MSKHSTITYFYFFFLSVPQCYVGRYLLRPVFRDIVQPKAEAEKALTSEKRRTRNYG